MVRGWMISLKRVRKRTLVMFTYITLIFLPLNCFPVFRDSETSVAFSYGQKQLLEAHICVVDSFLLLENTRLMLKLS